MVLVHLDTDIGGDLDDLCALAMVLRWPGVELTGITTVAEHEGRRAGYARYVLKLEGREDVPVASGAEAAGGDYREFPGLPIERRFWPEQIFPWKSPPGAAVSLLRKSIEQGAAIACIGPFTNLCLLERQHPGILSQAKLFLMGGYIWPPRPGYPRWGNEMDYNIQVDIQSARHVLQSSYPTLIPLSVTVETALRRVYLKSLSESGALGRLLAHQADVFAGDENIEQRIGKACPSLPPDIINFQHDPLACAIALGWDRGVTIESIPIEVEEQGGWLVEQIVPSGRLTRVVSQVDGPMFNEFWLRCIINRST